MLDYEEDAVEQLLQMVNDQEEQSREQATDTIVHQFIFNVYQVKRRRERELLCVRARARVCVRPLVGSCAEPCLRWNGRRTNDTGVSPRERTRQSLLHCAVLICECAVDQ